MACNCSMMNAVDAPEVGRHQHIRRCERSIVRNQRRGEPRVFQLPALARHALDGEEEEGRYGVHLQ